MNEKARLPPCGVDSLFLCLRFPERAGQSRNGNLMTDAATGTGPVDAVYKAISAFFRIRAPLKVRFGKLFLKFMIRAVSKIPDAHQVGSAERQHLSDGVDAASLESVQGPRG